MKYSIRFRLLPSQKFDGSTSVLIRVSWNSIRVDRTLDAGVFPHQWDKRTDTPSRTSKAGREAARMMEAVDTLFEQSRARRVFPSKAEVRSVLFSAQGMDMPVGDALLTEFIKSFMDDPSMGGSWSDNTRRNYNQLLSRLREWNANQSLAGMGRSQQQRFMDYCFSRGCINPTVQKYLKQLRYILHVAAEREMTVARDAQNFRPRYRTESEHDVIFLTHDELHRLIALELDSERLIHARDLFLFCCFTGLRYSDCQRLRHTDVREDTIHVVTKKTGAPLIIELNAVSLFILNRYGALTGEYALPRLSNQRLNDYLKELGEMAEITEPVKRVWWVRSERREETLPKWKLLSSHCGRKTFVVSALSLDIASEVVMKWTGHKNHETMKPYVAIVDQIKKKEMAKFDSLLPKIHPKNN